MTPSWNRVCQNAVWALRGVAMWVQTPILFSLFLLTPVVGSGVQAEDAPGLVLDVGGHRGGVSRLAFTPDQKKIVSAGADRIIRVWDIATGRTVQTLYGHTGRHNNGIINSLAVSPDGQLLAAAGYFSYRSAEGSMYYGIRIYDLQAGKLVRFLPGHTSEVTFLEFSRNGDRLISGSTSEAAVWSVADGRRLQQLKADDGMNMARLTPDGARMVTVGDDKVIRVWDVTSGKLIKSLKGHTERVTSLDVSKDTIVSAGEDGAVRLWSSVSGELMRTFKAPEYGGLEVAFGPDGAWLYAVAHTSEDAANPLCAIWNTATGKPMVEYREHTGLINAVAMSRDGRLMATTGGANHEIRVWDRATGQTQTTFGRVGPYPKEVAFAEESNAIAWSYSPCPESASCSDSALALERQLRLPLDEAVFTGLERVARQSGWRKGSWTSDALGGKLMISKSGDWASSYYEGSDHEFSRSTG